MCLTIKWHKKNKRGEAIARIASRNIKVFKVLDGNLMSPYYNFRYVLGRTFKSRLRVDAYTGRLEVRTGLHAFRKKKAAVSPMRHSPRELWVFSATIPKGSKYYLGAHGDIVSNRLIVVKKA